MQKMPGELIANRNQLTGFYRIRAELTDQIIGTVQRQNWHVRGADGYRPLR
jgi:hypothetical protein